jgi:sterol desaturase/sphingolipid hydroxylase (fatty acid hydroxylase superfamily)
VLYAGVVVPLVVLGGIGFAALVRRLAPWVVLPAAPAIPRWVFVAAALVATDAANWLAHWANHRVTTLWRLHAVHHTQTEMSILTGFRAHPAVHVSFLVASLPAIALARNGVVPAQVLVVYIVAATLPHANLRWGSGPVGRALGRVLVTPAFHRFHHDRAGPDGQNLGTVLVVWDLLAGTARLPRPDQEPVRTGMAPHPAAFPVTDPAYPADPADPGYPMAPGAGHLRTLALELAEPFVASVRRAGPDRDRADRTGRATPA